jgi:uncharacterized membrane protein
VSCPQCNTQLPDQVVFCTSCGLRMFVGAADERAPILLPDRILGAVAYFSFIPAVGFLVFEKFKRNRYLRFHSLQSIYLVVTMIVTGVVLRVLLAIFSLIPRIGHLLGWLVVVVTTLAFFMLWLVLIAKALQGERFQLPLLGQLAENSSNR